MSSVSILVIGIILVFLGLTDELSLLSESFEPKEGYRNIPVGTFVITGLVVVIPAYFLNQYNRRYAWFYVIMIILGYMITNYQGLNNFNEFLRQYINFSGAGENTPGPSGPPKSYEPV